MATPIAETPILFDEDAERFAYAVEHPRPVSRYEVKRAKATYERIKSSSPNFPF